MTSLAFVAGAERGGKADELFAGVRRERKEEGAPSHFLLRSALANNLSAFPPLSAPATKAVTSWGPFLEIPKL